METNQKPRKIMKRLEKSWKPTKNHETTLKNHGNQPKTMKKHETTLKNHGNQPKTMKNHGTTLKNHGNQPKTNFGRGRGGQGWNKQKRHKQTLNHNIFIMVPFQSHHRIHLK